ncbi:MAG: hypoxanthine phosphoribosyltransferase [Acidimicrobiales bacterium]
MTGPAVVHDAAAIATATRRLAAELSRNHPGGFVAVAVLKGSLFFLADLVREIEVPVEVDFLAVTRFAPDSGRVRLVKDLDIDITGRDVVLVEDVVDTGLSLGYLLGELRRRSPASLSVATLLDKRDRRILPIAVDHVGFVVADEFLLGYGLDYAGRYRNLRDIVVGDVDVLAADPDAYVAALYGS